MTQIGAPGDGPSRRDFLKATGAGGLAAAAGCTDPSARSRTATQRQQQAMQTQNDLPTTSPPEIVNVDEQGGDVTLSSVPAKHAVHPTDVHPGGMLTALVYKEAMDSDVFGELMEYTGYEG